MINKLLRIPRVSSTALIICFSLSLVLIYNYSAWNALFKLIPFKLENTLFIVSFALLLGSVFSLLLILVSFKWLLKPILIFIAISSSIAAYFMNSYGIAIDTAMIQNTIETNVHEATALLSLKLIIYLVLLGIIPSIIIWKTPVDYKPFWKGLLNKLLMLMACILTIVINVGSFYSTYATIFRDEELLTHFINPTNYLYAVGKYTKQSLVIKETLTINQIGTDAKEEVAAKNRPKKSVMVFVVGETARADHFSLNGYTRETNPELKKLDILNFTKVHSCGTSTAISVPCMFSMFPREDYSNKKGKTYESLLDVLQRAGMQVLWLENNSDCKGVCLRIPNEEISKTQPNNPFCKDKECLDESLLVNLQPYLDQIKDNTLIVLHSMGSHGPEYYKRYPKELEKFTPVCRTNQFSTCTQEELINVYDDSILYTDYFLSKVVELLKSNQDRFDTAMWYVSDHGESLGENGVYLHAAPYAIAPEAQTHVPMVMWFGQNTLENQPLDPQCLKHKQDDPSLSHDHIFHSLLGYFSIQTTVYQPTLDLFQSCRMTTTASSTK